MEIVKPELETCSSIKELSRFKGTTRSTSDDQRIKNGSILVYERFERERAKYHCNWETLSIGKKGVIVKKPLLVGCSRGKALNVSCKGKAVLSTNDEVEELNERLRVLEEETETMMHELFEGAEERKKLMNEIYQQFEILGIHPRYLVTREFKSDDGNSSVNSSQEERMETSLSDILHQDPRPSLVTRNLRANTLALLM